MAKKWTASVSGLKEIDELLRKLPRSNSRSIIRSSLREGGNVIVKEIRKNIDKIPDVGSDKSSGLWPGGKDRFKKATGVVTSKDRTFEGKVYAGPRYAGVKHIAPDAHLIEFGTDERFTEEGEYRGRIYPTPFIRPAWDSKKVEAVRKIKEALVNRTLKEAVKLRNM